MSRATVCKKFKFEAAHQLPHHDGKCANLHGHSYVLMVWVTSAIREVKQHAPHPKEGMVVDFSHLSEVVKGRVVDRLDHKFLNSELQGEIEVTTAELLAEWVFGQVVSFIPDLSKVRLYETADCYAEVTAEDFFYADQ